MSRADATKPVSLLAAFLGSGEAADAWRRGERLRERVALQAALCRDLKALAREQQPVAPTRHDCTALVRAEIQRFRAELPDLIRRVLADELPEAVEYLVRSAEEKCDGTTARR